MAGRQPLQPNSPALNDLHYGSFVNASDGKPALAVVNVDGTPLGIGFSTPGIFTLNYDTIKVTYPNTTTEVYTSYVGGLSGSLQQTATVVYVDATKVQLTSVVRS